MGTPQLFIIEIFQIGVNGNKKLAAQAEKHKRLDK